MPVSGAATKEMTTVTPPNTNIPGVIHIVYLPAPTPAQHTCHALRRAIHTQVVSHTHTHKAAAAAAAAVAAAAAAAAVEPQCS